VNTLGPIDVHHRGADRVIGCYLLETEDGPALFDCGPTSGITALKEGLSERGLALTDVRHLLLSHIHLDHAGGTGSIVREHPHLQVHVSDVGARHLIDPTRLERSARRLYGEAFDDLWGQLAPVPEQNIHPVGTSTLGLETFPTTGHAEHHVSYLTPEGTLLAGDAAGVRIQPDDYVSPPTPPPEFDLAAWERSLDEIERRRPARLALIHFGVVDDPEQHLAQLRARLHSWTALVRDGATEEQFLAQAIAERDRASRHADIGEKAMPLWQCYAGIRRYVDRLQAGAPATTTA
jgi:glyoxylase-like metal-dependent hydrolase (beta-lactamase superfamily II)